MKFTAKVVTACSVFQCLVLCLSSSVLYAHEADSIKTTPLVGFRWTQMSLSDGFDYVMPMWYPIDSTWDSSPMKVVDYLSNTPGPTKEIRESFLMSVARSYHHVYVGGRNPNPRALPSTEVTNMVLDEYTRALWEPESKSGQHPVVLMGYGDASSVANFNGLAEALAGAGFVVLLAPEPVRQDDDLAAINIAYGEHLHELVRHLNQIPNADTSRVAVIDNWGIPALLLQSKEARIKAFAVVDEPPIPEELVDFIDLTKPISMLYLKVENPDIVGNAMLLQKIRQVDYTAVMLVGAQHGLTVQYRGYFERQRHGSTIYDDAIDTIVNFFVDKLILNP